MVGTFFMGRLGNNMFQYAYIRSVAERKNYDFYICSNSDEIYQFNNIFPHLNIYDKVGNCNEHVELMDKTNFLNSYYDLNDNMLTNGFFQNFKYFDGMPIRDWFKIYLNENEELKFNEILNRYNPNEYCYIHFRGTDFQLIEEYYTSPEWFEEAKKLSGSDKFLVITDDIERAKNFINADDFISSNYKIDLKLLTSSKKIIIPTFSTFGWWGAWLSDAEIIITPKNMTTLSNNPAFKEDELFHVNDRFTYL